MDTLYRSEKDGSLTEIHGDRAAVPLKQNTVLGAEANHWGGSGLFPTQKDWLKFTDMLRRAFREEKNLAASPVRWVDPVTDISVMFFSQVKPSSRLRLRFEIHRLAASAISRSV